jgi:transcriptional regulator with XRE-family HTH domain
MNDIANKLAARLKQERDRRGWSLAELAARAEVSTGMISKIERAAASPTAAVLGRLSGAFGLTLSTLLEGVDPQASRLSRRTAQASWQDPATKYRRRSLSPATGGPLQLVEITLPPGASIAYPAAAYEFLHQQIWILSGMLHLTEGIAVHELAERDCFEFGPACDHVFTNPGAEPCRYLVALVTRGR